MLTDEEQRTARDTDLAAGFRARQDYLKNSNSVISIADKIMLGVLITVGIGSLIWVGFT